MYSEGSGKNQRTETRSRLATDIYPARLERYLQAQLNLSRVVRIERAGNFAEVAIPHVGIYRTQVSVIENVQKVKPELQIALFPEPGQAVVLQNARIHLNHARVAIELQPGAYRRRLRRA